MTRSTRLPACLLCLSGILLACCGQITPGGTVDRTTVGDTLIVTTTPPIEPGESLFRFEPDLVLGVAEGESEDDPYMFSWIVDLAVDENGQMYVSEYGDREIRVFDSEGRFQNRFGRAGQGPGEFHSGSYEIQPVSALHDGRVVVQDHPHSLEVFGPDGGYETSIDLTPLSLTTRTPGRAFFPIRWLSRSGQLIIPWRESRIQEGTAIRFLITDESLSNLQWLSGRLVYTDSYTEGSRSIALPFTGNVVWTITGESVLVQAKSDSYRLIYYDLTRDRWLHAILNIEPEPVTSEEVRLYKDQRLSRMSDAQRARMEPLYNRATFPKVKPFFSHLMGDDEKRLWVARDVETYLLGTPDTWRYDLFNDRGEWLGIVKSPHSWDLIRNGYAYIVTTDEFQVIKRYKIIPTR